MALLKSDTKITHIKAELVPYTSSTTLGLYNQKEINASKAIPADPHP